MSQSPCGRSPSQAGYPSCLGEPLPLQLANGTQSSLTALIAFIIIGCPIIIILGISIRFQMLSLPVRQVLYALLTRPPPKPKLKTQIQVDLHVLSILSAFILSQDQTLRSIFSYSSFCYFNLTPILWLLFVFSLFCC